MQVRDAMTTGPVVVTPDQQVRSVVEKMIRRSCGAIPVVDADYTLVGIVTIRDIMLPLYPNCGEYMHDEVHGQYFLEMEEKYPDVLDMFVRDVMTPQPVYLSPDDLALKAASIMGVKNFRRLPVCDRGKLLGMISIGDINRALFMDYVESLQRSETVAFKAANMG